MHLEGKNYEDVFPKALEQGLKKSYSKMLKQKTPFDVIIDHYIPQFYSKQMTFHARGAPFSSGEYFVLLSELEDELYHVKKLVEKRTKELQKSKKLMESIIDSSPNIIITTDLKNSIITFNRTAENIFGYGKEDVLKKKIQFLFKKFPFPDKRGKENLSSPRELICVRKDESTFPVSFLTSDVRNALGKAIAKLYLLNDLSEKKAMEERLFLSEKLALYSELMGGIAHQLNNPLVGVVNFSEMLWKEMDDDDPKKGLADTISKAGKECLRITRSVLNCIKDPHLTFSKTDLHEVITDALQALNEQFGDKLKGVSIERQFDPRISSISGDSVQLKQCFLNILTNAVQAMPQGGKLKIETKQESHKNEIQVLFSDSGIGISQEYISNIFLPFFSLQKSSDRHGLGLSFAYQIIKNHYGYLNVESKVGLGTTFTIFLPLEGID
jgi:PAS domain S-box-containing protein